MTHNHRHRGAEVEPDILAEVSPNDVRQMALPFAAGTDPDPLATPLVGMSRRDLRVDVASKRVRLGATERSPDEVLLEEALWSCLPPGKTLALSLTDNRYTMVAVRRAASGYKVRLHRMFASGDAKLVRALARYVVHNDRRASGIIGEYIEANQHIIRQQGRRTRGVKLRTAGQSHDLQRIFDHLNKAHFDGALDARITWGPGSKRRARSQHSIKMGSFAVEDRIIRIHPVLDNADVPGYFVAWIVFHEMLHGKHEVVRRGGRRCFHSREFLAEERTFPEFQRASAWEKANIEQLLGPADASAACAKLASAAG